MGSRPLGNAVQNPASRSDPTSCGLLLRPHFIDQGDAIIIFRGLFHWPRRDSPYFTSHISLYIGARERCDWNPFSMRYHLVLSIAALALAACTGQPPIQSIPGLTVFEGQTELPVPSRGDLVAQDRLALVGPLDNLSVSVFGVPELSREMQVDAGGRIAMPLIGAIDAGGKTAAELARDIEHQLSGRYVRRPNVTVNIISSVSQVVTIDGQVVEPGLYPVTNQMTLLRAVASARGLSEFADEDDVVILRTVEGKRIAGLYNLGAIRRGLYDDPPIYANDLVVVGDSPQRRLFRDFVGVAPLLAGPIIALLQR